MELLAEIRDVWDYALKLKTTKSKYNGLEDIEKIAEVLFKTKSVDYMVEVLNIKINKIRRKELRNQMLSKIARVEKLLCE